MTCSAIIREVSSCSIWEKIQRFTPRLYVENERPWDISHRQDVSIKSLPSGFREPQRIVSMNSIRARGDEGQQEKQDLLYQQNGYTYEHRDTGASYTGHTPVHTRWSGS